MSSIKITNVYKRIGSIEALGGISFNSKENEFITVLGPSGCGKTTMLRSIAGLENIDKGKIEIDDIDVTCTEPKDRNIAMVFQNHSLYPQKTVYKNLEFPLKILKQNKNQIREKVIKVAKLLEIEDLLNRKPNTLSGGQKQRVAIGKAMMKNPKVFLFDEPLSNLDASLRDKMIFEIKKLHNELNSVFIYVTHDQNEAMSLGDRIIVMQNGNIQQVGTPFEIYNNPKNIFVASFVGNPKINIINKDMYTKLFNSKTDLEENITYGIRPEHLTIKEYKNQKEFGVIKSIEDRGRELVYNVSYNEYEIKVCCPRDNNKKEFLENDKVVCNGDIKKLIKFNLSGNSINFGG